MKWNSFVNKESFKKLKIIYKSDTKIIETMFFIGFLGIKMVAF
jgi:hypothetical protein